MFPEQLYREYLKMHMTVLYPNQPDMLWDYPMFWSGRDNNGFSVFCSIVVDGQHQNNWGAFCEQWFIHMDAPIDHL